ALASGSDRVERFLVGAKKLLRARDKARLYTGIAAGFVDETGLDAVFRRKQCANLLTGRIVAENREEPHRRTDRGEVAHHVAGTAQHAALALDAQHGDRGFGRNALDRAIDIAVEHHVPETQDADPGEGLGLGGKGGAIDGTHPAMLHEAA